MNPKTFDLDLTGYYVSLLLSETPPPPAFVRLDLTTPETNRDGKVAGTHPTRMEWEFFVRVCREIQREGPDELILSNLGDAAACTWLLDAILFAKHFCRFPHVVLQTDIATTSARQVSDAIQGGLDCLILNFNLSSRRWRERAVRQIGEDSGVFRRCIEEALRVRDEHARNKRQRCLIYVSRLGGRQGDDALGRAIDEVVGLADHDYFDWLPETQDLLGVPEAPTACAGDRRCQCWTPFTEAHVAADGSLVACRHDYFGSSRVADLNTASFQEAWHSQGFQDTRIRLIQGEVSGTLCHSCPIRSSYPVQR